ncbi:MAG: KilA-N domain-containing protein [Lentimicrobiaceae bacterium]|nr:KilA-N domain-containing protein [Lentimicrobiaceae bacterium]MBQ2907824.1 KilA-N domain-containing protein [Bacteroidales bacterium]
MKSVSNHNGDIIVHQSTSRIKIQDSEITIISRNEDDFISLTDMARSQLQEHIIFRWLSLKSTIEYLGEWEMLYNSNFNCTEFDTIRNNAGSNNYVLSVKTWIEKTNAIGIFSKAGRYGGTYAHRDIAYHFGMWISPRFQLLLIKEYQRLKSEEQRIIGWTAKRDLAKINYHIHTSAVSCNLIPKEITQNQVSIIYAEEADVLNVALFGITAKQWREKNPDSKGNIRDYASLNELICLSNMENINAVLINDGVSQKDRLIKLNQIAIQQMQILMLKNKNDS